MLLLGIDIGTSSIKISVVDAATQASLGSMQYPEVESPIISLQPGWAEQSPEMWWEHVQKAILGLHSKKLYNPKDISAIGIAYQMHGLVCVDKDQQVLRNSIIWCDSRAVELGNKAFREIGEERCLTHLLNSPGNFTASKLAWVKKNEPAIYRKIDKVMLPGDFIAMRLTGTVSTSASALSEGILWDFKNDSIAEEVLDYFGFDLKLFPEIKRVFSPHGQVSAEIASKLSLTPGIPVSYKAGDQPNNALSLNVLQPGEVAATAGTSGVIYGVSDLLNYDLESRINSFAHVNHSAEQLRVGVLLCINGVGIFNRWIKTIAGGQLSYKELNDAASKIPIGSEGLFSLPFGNGAERMLNNQIVGGQFYGIDFNKHTTPHMIRAVQEGIAFAFRYGLDIMRENGIEPKVIRASKANLFLSDVFAQSFADTNKVNVEFYEGDGSFGAALGAGIGAGIFKDAIAAAKNRKPIGTISTSNNNKVYDALYEQWKELLNSQLNKLNNQYEPKFSLS